MKDFKRVYTMFEGREVIIKGREQFIPQQRVKIVRMVNMGDAEDEGQFVVEFTNLGTAVVDGCDLHPHPVAPATNVELFEHIANNGRTAMTQAFMIDAIGKVADAVVASADKVKADMEGTMISGELWVDTAKEIQAALAARS